MAVTPIRDSPTPLEIAPLLSSPAFDSFSFQLRETNLYIYRLPESKFCLIFGLIFIHT